MTAEIAILNRQGLALAADSAVTIGRERVHKTTSKLFSLGPTNDIAIMIYGSGALCGYPWDTIIKSYRQGIKGKKFATVKECAEDFVEHVRTGPYVPDMVNEAVNSYMVVEILEAIKKALNGFQKKADFLAGLKLLLERHSLKLEEMDTIRGFCSAKEFAQNYGDAIHQWSEECFERKLSKATHKLIADHIYLRLSKEKASRYHSGVVFAGYGESEYFPAIELHIFDGKDKFGLRSWLKMAHDSNEHESEKTAIFPFAQSDMAYLFMEGISPDQLEFIEKTLTKLLAAKSDELIKIHVPVGKTAVVEKGKQRKENEAAVKAFMEEFQKYRKTEVVTRILDVVEHLPKDELADMAMAIVELTSLRRKVDSNLETVGGPVDVAVISKGDGLVWINRKSYFDDASNRAYLQRRYGALFGYGDEK